MIFKKMSEAFRILIERKVEIDIIETENTLKYHKTQMKNLTPALCFHYSQSKGTAEASEDKNLKAVLFLMGRLTDR